MSVRDLKRGTVVVALRQLDIDGANVSEGDLGVVFEEDEFHGPAEGPMVQWMSSTYDVQRDTKCIPGGRCNVYEGDVEAVTS